MAHSQAPAVFREEQMESSRCHFHYFAKQRKHRISDRCRTASRGLLLVVTLSVLKKKEGGTSGRGAWR